MLMTPALGQDWLAWTTIRSVLDILAVGPTSRLRVCEGCTAVFQPGRTDHFHCNLCQKRVPAPPLTPARMNRELAKPGDRLRARVPVFAASVVLAWGERTIGRCLECGEPFIAGSAKQAYCSDAHGKRWNRRAP
jgi:hypothetical protein